MQGVTEDRLTRQELGWLLMQEARGTARALRQEVGQLQFTQERVSDPPPAVEGMLDALDGAIDMMSALESPTGTATHSHGKERRVRIDIATVLFDLAPNARLAIAPGAGTEVFAVEQELKRMLGLLAKQSGSEGTSQSTISVHREDEWVVICVGLGPEGMPTRDLEHRWLNRMALRHGGRVELTGNETKLYLPADAESGHEEIRQLRKELEQAQQLGAVYAKELAEAFTFAKSDSVLPAPANIQPSDEDRLRLLVAASGALHRNLRTTTEQLKSDVTKLSRLLGEGHELVGQLGARLLSYGELVVDLERMARVVQEEPERSIDLAELLREVANSADGRSQRQEVSLSLETEGAFPLKSRPSIVSLLLRSLLDQSLQATPRGGKVRITLRRTDTPEHRSYGIAISDGGPQIPDFAVAGLLQGTADPSSFGRPSALSWIALGAAAAALGVAVETGESPTAATEIRLTIG